MTDTFDGFDAGPDCSPLDLASEAAASAETDLRGRGFAPDGVTYVGTYDVVDPDEAAGLHDAVDDTEDGTVGPAEGGEGEYGFGTALWDGDEGDLLGPQRDVLVLVLKEEFISAETYPREWKTLIKEPSTIRRMLNNLYLDLHVDEDRQVAFKRPVRSPDRKFRSLIYDKAHNREETLLLVFLRERLRAEGAAGERHVFVDVEDMHEFVERFRPPHATNEKADHDRVERAIALFKTMKLISQPQASQERYQISRALEALVPLSKLQQLLAALQEQNARTRGEHADLEDVGRDAVAEGDDVERWSDDDDETAADDAEGPDDHRQSLTEEESHQ